MGCEVDYGSCKEIGNCEVMCMVKFGSAATGYCAGGNETGRWVGVWVRFRVFLGFRVQFRSLRIWFEIG
ncbi:hypothetical protein YC2023_073665 [Brassica napus]